jgi:hypothetical protein
MGDEGTRWSRRAVLQGMGVVAGATVVGAAAAEVAGATPGTAGSEPLPAVGQAVPEVVTPGLAYRTYGMFAFHPNNSAIGRQVSTTGAWAPLADGFLIAPLDLPAGALIREITCSGVNTSGVAALFLLERSNLTTGAGAAIVSPSLPSGAGLRTVTARLNHVVDPEFGYDVALFTRSNGSVRVFGARVGFAGPYGFSPVEPQVRKLDTRAPGPLTGKIARGQTKVLSLAPQVPGRAKAAVITLTITATESAGGFLSLYPAGTPNPGTSTINWSAPGLTLATSATVAVSAASAIAITCGGPPAARTHVLVDLIGFYQ